MAGGNSGASGGRNTMGGKSNLSMNVEKQNRHIPGTREFDPFKSPIDLVTPNELDTMIKENISAAKIKNNHKLTLDLPKNIGHVKTQNGKIVVTNSVTIHLSRTGYHAVPRLKGKKYDK